VPRAAIMHAEWLVVGNEKPLFLAVYLQMSGFWSNFAPAFLKKGKI
jgi:hypothetical protein